MATPDFQQRYFSKLAERFPSNQAMVESLSSRLHLSRDAIYRRLRGASQLTANELAVLAEAFAQPLPDGNYPIPFRYNRSERTIRRPEDYFEQLEVHLAHVRQLETPSLYVANPGIPIFYEMLYPRLHSLKLYVYGNTCWNFAAWQRLPYSHDLIDPNLLARAAEISAVSLQLPGVELWSLGILNTTLDQIEYLHVAGRFTDPGEPIQLLDELEHLVDYLNDMARAGRKFAPGTEPTEASVPFNPVHNELANNDNAILIRSGSGSRLFVTFLTPNFLQTEDAGTCRETQDWFERMAAVSGSLGPGAAKYRQWYFSRLRSQIEATRRRIAANAF